IPQRTFPTGKASPFEGRAGLRAVVPGPGRPGAERTGAVVCNPTGLWIQTGQHHFRTVSLGLVQFAWDPEFPVAVGHGAPTCHRLCGSTRAGASGSAKPFEEVLGSRGSHPA